MRIAGGLAASAVAAGIVLAGLAVAPAAHAAVAVAAPSVIAAPVIHSHYAELMNAATGANLWSRSSVVQHPMGSVTKVMTAYVVLTTPGLNLNRVITVPSGIISYDAGGASTAGLHPGEQLTTRQLLYAMMLPSGCDAAYALADAYGSGSSTSTRLNSFIGKMNGMAHHLGMSKTKYTDFSGLPYPTGTSTESTAHDLLILGRAAMRNATFAAIVATRRYTVAAGSHHLAHTWNNLDPLLGTYAGAIGIKTGYTGAAGQCLLFEARRGSKTLIGVVLDSSSVNSPTLAAADADADAMLNWGFSQ